MTSFSKQPTSNGPPFTTLKSEAGKIIKNETIHLLNIKRNKELTRVHSGQTTAIINARHPLLRNKISFKKRQSFQKYPK